MAPAVPDELRQFVVQRAQGHCEYCQMLQSIQGATFYVEHIIPLSKSGESSNENLALACPSCNFHKSDCIEAEDPESGKGAPLFNPRKHRWADHFRLDGVSIAPSHLARESFPLLGKASQFPPLPPRGHKR